MVQLRVEYRKRITGKTDSNQYIRMKYNPVL